MNFECANHVDVVDEVPSAREDMLSDLKTIIGDLAIGGKRLEKAKNANNFLRCHSSSTSMTCCYQFLHDYDDLKVKQFFCMPSLGICYCIKSYWAHGFMASCFLHLTSALIYITGGKVFIGKIPQVTIFACGKGGPAKM